MVEFFIRRPIFASVCALLIILAGAVCIPQLPISLYPQLAPPQVTVTSVYIGANAQTVEHDVTTQLETAINGVEGMRYMTSSSGNDGKVVAPPAETSVAGIIMLSISLLVFPVLAFLFLKKRLESNKEYKRYL